MLRKAYINHGRVLRWAPKCPKQNSRINVSSDVLRQPATCSSFTLSPFSRSVPSSLKQQSDHFAEMSRLECAEISCVPSSSREEGKMNNQVALLKAQQLTSSLRRITKKHREEPTSSRSGSSPSISQAKSSVSATPSINPASEKEELIKLLNACGRSAYFLHVVRQSHLLDPSRFSRKSSLHPVLGNRRKVKKISSPPLDLHLMLVAPWAVQIHRRWDRLPGYRKLYWALYRSHQGPRLRRLVYGQVPVVPSHLKTANGISPCHSSILRAMYRKESKSEEGLRILIGKRAIRARKVPQKLRFGNTHLSKQPVFLPSTATSLSTQTQRVWEAQKHSMEKNNRNIWKRRVRKIFFGMNPGAASTFIKELKVLQKSGGTKDIEVCSPDLRTTGHSKAYPGKSDNSASAASLKDQKDIARVMEEDFLDYCSAWGITHPRKAFVMANLWPLLDQLEASSNNQVHQVKNMVNIFSDQYDALIASMAHSERGNKSMNTNGENAALGKEDSSPNTIELRSQEKDDSLSTVEHFVLESLEDTRSRLRTFQKELPLIKELLQDNGE